MQIKSPEISVKSTVKTNENLSWKPSQDTPPAVTDTPPTSAFSSMPTSSSRQSQEQADLFTQKSSPSHAPSTAPSSSSVIPPESSPSQPVQNGIDHHVSTSMLHLKDEPSRLPPSQSPYITLLQKNRGLYFYM